MKKHAVVLLLLGVSLGALAMWFLKPAPVLVMEPATLPAKLAKAPKLEPAPAAKNEAKPTTPDPLVVAMKDKLLPLVSLPNAAERVAALQQELATMKPENALIYQSA
jgi:hypothetical protein